MERKNNEHDGDMHLRPYEKLIAWQEAYRLCLSLYSVTITFPAHEKFGLADQMRRAACSVPLNIAEGNAKRTSKEKGRSFEIAIGSLEELHCQTRIAFGLKYISQATLKSIDDHLQRTSCLLTNLRASL